MTLGMIKPANLKESTFNAIRVSVTYVDETVIEVEMVELIRNLLGTGSCITRDFGIEALEVWSHSLF
jgi:hypothetical protein